MKDKEKVSEPLRILHLEDSTLDAEIIKERLIGAGFSIQMDWVSSEQEFTRSLEHGNYDLVLADYMLPGFNALAALQIMKSYSPDLPFIVISGAIGEEKAVDLLKKGATDYVSKDRLEKLPLAINRALDEVREHNSRRRAEEDLRRMNERFLLATRAASLGVWDLDLRKNELIWDDRMYELYGKARENFAGTYEAWLECIHPDDREASDKISRLALLGNDDYETEYRVIWPDGVVRHLKAHGLIVRDADGKPLRMTGINFDITEQKAMESLLKAREEEYRTLAQNIPDSLARYDRNCRMVYANPRMFESIASEPESLLGRTPLEVNSGDTEGAGVFQQALTQVMESDEAMEVEVEVLSPSGEKRIHSVRCVSEYGPDGKVIGALSLGRDITERKQMEDAIENERLMLKTLIATIPEPIWLKDNEGRYLSCNYAFTRLYDRSEEELIGTTDYDHVDRDIADFFRKKDREAIEADSPRMNEEWVTFKSDGHRELWETIKTPLVDVYGRVIGVLGVARDIADRKQMEEELREKEQYQRALLDNFPFMVWLKDTNSRLLAVNKAYAEAAGVEEVDAFTGKSDLDFWPADLAENYRRDDREVLLRGEKKNVEELIEERGERKWFETYKAPVVVDGILLGTVGFARDITERKEMENALENERTLLRKLIETLPDPVWVKNPEGVFLTCNNAFSSLFGKDEASVCGKTDYDFVEQKQADFFRENDRHAMESDEPRMNEEWVTFVGDGHRELWETRKTRLLDSSGRLIGVLGIARDVTDRKLMEEALRESEQQFRTLAENSPNLIIRYNRECRRIYVNPAYVRETENLSEMVMGVVPAGDWKGENLPAEDYVETLRQVMDTGIPRTFPVVWKGAQTGRILYYDVQIVPEWGSDGEVHGVLAIGHNISALTEKNRHLEETRARLDSILRTIPDLIWLKDTNGKYLSCNPTFERFFGAPEHDIIGKTDYDFVDRDLADSFRQTDLEALETDEINIKRKWITFADDGHRAFVETRKVRVLESDGNVIGVLGISRDVTEQDRLEADRQRFVEILEESVDFVGMADMNGNLSYHNRAARQMIGLPEDADLTGMNIADIHPAWATEKIRDIIMPILNKRGVWRGESAVLHRDGHEIPVLQLITLHRGVDGTPEYTSTIMQDITDQKALENLLKAKEEEYRTLAENIPDLISRYNLECRRTFVNQALLDLLGEPAYEVLGKTPLETPFSQGEEGLRSAKESLEAIERVLQSGNSEETELFWTDSEGSYHHYQIRFSPEFDPEGKLISVLSVARDIAGLKKVENELKERERRYREIFENSQDSIYLLEVTPDGHFRNLEFNPAFERSTGVKKELMLGKTIDEVNPPEVAAAVNAKYQRCLEIGDVYEEEVELELPVGRRIFHSTLIPVRDDNGEFYRITGITRDITERKDLMESLVAKEQEFRTLAENAPDNIIRYDREGRTLYINSAAEKTLGTPVGALIGVLPSEWDGGPEFNTIYEATLFHVLESGEPAAIEVPVQLPAGIQQIHSIKFAAEKNEHGIVTGAVAIGRDITERREMQKALEEREREFRTLAENIPDNIARYDRECRLVYMNPALKDTLRQDPLLLYGKTPIEANVADPDVNLNYENHIRHVLETGERESFEITMPGKSGDPGIHLLSLVGERDERGEITGVIGIGRDVTERRKMEDALRKSEARYRESSNLLQSIFNSASDVVILALDRDYRYLTFNETHRETARRLWGAEISVGMNMLGVFTKAEDLEFAKQGFDAVLAGNVLSVESKHEPIIDGHSEFEYYQNYASPIFSDTGEVTGLTLFGVNTTERKRMEMELDAREAELRFLAEYSPGMIGTFYLRPDGTICMPYVSSSVFELFGLRPEDLSEDAGPLLEKTHPEDTKRVRDSILESAQNMSRWHQEYRIIHPTRGERWMEGNTNPMPHPDGGVMWYGYVQDITDRKIAEEKQRESEARYRENSNLLQSIFESPTGMSIYAMDRNYRLLAFNSRFRDAARRLWNADIAIGMNILDAIDTDEHREFARQGFDQVLAGRSFSLESKEAVVRDGVTTYEYHDNFGAPIRDDNGVIVGLTVFAIEITERKHMEELLHEREQAFRALAENSPDAILRYDLDLRRIYINPAMERELGLTAEEMLGKTSLDDPRTIDPEKMVRALRDVRDTGKESTCEMSIRHHSGAIHWVGLRIVPEFDPEGKVVSILSIGRDITDLKVAQEALQKSEEMYRSVVSSMAEGIVFQTAPEGKITTVNQAAERILGIRGEEMIGRSIEDLDDRIITEDGENFSAELLPAPVTLKTGKPEFSVIMGIRKSDDTTTWISVNSQPVVLPGESSLYGVICTFHDITERLKAERALKESEAIFKAAFHQSPAALSITSLKDQVFLDVNDVYVRESGYSRDELIGHSNDIQLWAIDEERNAFREAMAAEGRASDLNITFRRKDGSIGYAFISGTVITVRGEMCVLAQIHVVTAQREAENALRESEKHYRSIFENMPTSLYVFDVSDDGEFIISDVNPAALKAGGFSREMVVGNRMDPEIARPETFEAYRRVVETGETFHYKDHFTYQGRTIHSDAYIVPLKNESSKVYRLIGLSRDITEEVIMEKTIEKLNADLSATLLAIPDLLFEVDQNGRYLNVWAKNEELLARRKSELLGHTIGDVLSEGAAQIILEAIRDADKTGSSYGKIMQIDFPERTRWFELSISRKALDSNDAVSFIILSRDITERKQMEDERAERERAEAAVRAKSEFLANISHEIRTPLNAILGFTELLAARIQEPEKLSYLKSIQNGGEILLSTVNDFLDFTRMETGKLEPKFEPFDLERLADEIKELFAYRAKSKGLEFSVVQENAPPGFIRFDRARLRQVLINLVENAVKFTTQGFVRVHIESEKESENHVKLLIEVEDSGPGIPESDREKVFDPFVQVKEATGGGGTGLGLAITNRIITLYGGRVSVKESSAGGALFQAVIPGVACEDDKNHRIKEDLAKKEPTYDFYPATILVAEDNNENRNLLRGILSTHPFYIVEARNGEEAIKLTEKYNPDLVLMDLLMPQLNGREAAHRIREEAERVPIIIAVTASVQDEDVESPIEEPIFDGMILKPVRQRDLLEMISGYLPKRMDEKGTNLSEADREYLMKNRGDEVLQDHPDIDFKTVSAFCRKTELEAMKTGAYVICAWSRLMRDAADKYNITSMGVLRREFEKMQSEVD